MIFSILVRSDENIELKNINRGVKMMWFLKNIIHKKRSKKLNITW